MSMYYCTQEGYDSLSKKLNKLMREDRPLIVEELSSIAKESGSDLAENFEYIQASEELSLIDKKISEIKEKITNSKVIDITKIPFQGKVLFGTTVKIYDLEEDYEAEYKIVGEDESDVSLNKISYKSPLASSILSKSVGDEALFNTPKGKRIIEILEINHI